MVKGPHRLSKNSLENMTDADYEKKRLERNARLRYRDADYAKRFGINNRVYTSVLANGRTMYHFGTC